MTGNHPLLGALERQLAAYKGTEDAIVFGSGYLATVGIIPVLAQQGDLILADRLVHACMIDGARMAGAKLLRFRHNDAGHLSELLTRHRGSYRHCLILSETVFSMDGDRAPLPELCMLAEAHDSWLLSDDAHGLGLLRRDTAAAPLQMGTLSKTLGSYGGYLCASAPVIKLMRNRARSFIYSTALPPAPAAAALAALELVVADPAWAASPIEKAALFAAELGLPRPHSAIVPVIIGGARQALEASWHLEGHGYLAAAIRPPTVPPGTARLRFTFSPAHRDDDIREVASYLRPLLTKVAA